MKGRRVVDVVTPTFPGNTGPWPLGMYMYIDVGAMELEVFPRGSINRLTAHEPNLSEPYVSVFWDDNEKEPVRFALRSRDDRILCHTTYSGGSLKIRQYIEEF